VLTSQRRAQQLLHFLVRADHLHNLVLAPAKNASIMPWLKWIWWLLQVSILADRHNLCFSAFDNIYHLVAIRRYDSNITLMCRSRFGNLSSSFL
jgi:hypothetical protein